MEEDKHKGLSKNNDSGDSKHFFDVKACSDVLKEIDSKMAQIPGASGVTCQENENSDDDENDESSDGEEFSEAKEFVEESKIDENSEYDEAYLKELYDNMSEEQLEQQKGKANSLKVSGNDQYKSGNFREAMESYTKALNMCPLQFTSERSILYANRAAAKVSLENNDGAVLDCNKALELNPHYLKALMRRAGLHRKMENLDQSLTDYKQILEMDRNNAEARQACLTLPGEINERNEKLKTEMLGKLKDLGNTILRPFGLSTNNFNVVQDPNSGGYSINFQGNQGKN